MAVVSKVCNRLGFKCDETSIYQTVLFALSVYFVVMAVYGIVNEDEVQEFERDEWKAFFVILVVFGGLQLISMINSYMHFY